MSHSDANIEFVGRLGEEFVARLRRGEKPSIREYVERHPEHRAVIEDVFPTLLMLENLAPEHSDSVCGSPAPELGLLGAPPLGQLGDYRLIREVGRGGMGIVYEAEQVSLGRHVALKVLPSAFVANAKQRQRFEREAKAAAKLHHTNIVPVFGVGENDGQVYYVMQFIQGLALDDVLHELVRMEAEPGAAEGSSARGELRVNRRAEDARSVALSLKAGSLANAAAQEVSPLDATVAGPAVPPPSAVARGAETSRPGPRVRSASPTTGGGSTGRLSDVFAVSSSSVVLQRAGKRSDDRPRRPANYFDSVAHIGVQVADALDYAHGQGVLHRDVKPANLVLDVKGTVWVTDFGLAKLDDERNLTQTGDILGTLRYMAPETFKGDFDARSEVYSLGLTLYEMLSLRPAFDQTNRNSLIQQVMNASVEPLGKRRPEIPADLQTIVHKAIERDASHRYQTAKELAEDLQRFLDDEPIRARRVTSLEQLARWGRHNRGLAASLSVVALLVCILAIASSIAAGYFQILSGRQRLTLLELQSKSDQLEKARNSAVSAAEHNDELARRNADLARANQQAATEADEARRRADELRRLAEERERFTVGTLYAAEMNLAAQAAESPSGMRRVQQLVERWNRGRSETDQRGWEWYYLQSLAHRETRTLVHPGAEAVAWRPDGKRLASCSRDGRIRIWIPETGALERTLAGHADYVQDVAWSPDGSRLASGGRDKTVKIWDAESGGCTATFTGHRYSVFGVAWNDDGTRLASTASDGPGELIVWDVATGREQLRQEVAGGETRVAWRPGTTHVSLSQGAYDVTDGRKIGEHSGWRVAWSRDAQRHAATEGGKVWVHSGDFAQLEREFTAHGESVDELEFSSDGRWLATASLDNSIKIWNARTWEPAARLDGHVDWVTDVSWSPDDRQLATVASGVIRIWNWPLEETPLRFDVGGHSFRTLAWSADGSNVAIAGSQGLSVVDLATRTAAARLDASQLDGFSMFSPVMSRHSAGGLLVGRRQGAWVAWNEGAWTERTQFADPQNDSRGFALSPDGRWLATTSWAAGENGERMILRRFDVASGKEAGVATLSSDLAGSVAWSPDGRRIALGGWNTAGVFDVESNELLWTRPLTGMNWVYALAWNPAGDALAVGCMNRMIHVVDARSGSEKLTISGHDAEVLSVAWHPDGSRLVSGGKDDLVRIWQISTGAQLMALKGHPTDVVSVGWSPDGLSLASLSVDGQLRIWSAETGYLRDESSHVLKLLERRLQADPGDLEALRTRRRIRLRIGDQAGSTEDARLLQELLAAKLATDDPNAAEELAALLMETSPAPAETPLRPVSLSSRLGATLTRLDDDSILASGPNSQGDVYEVRIDELPAALAGVRLEVLPHVSLPGGGPGRHPTGNFQLEKVRAFLSDPERDDEFVAAPFREATASYQYATPDVAVEALIDETSDKKWHVWGRLGEAHHADFYFPRPVEGDGRRLRLEFASISRGLDAVNLGRFRLVALSGSARDAHLRRLLERRDLRGDVALAVARLATGAPAETHRLLASRDLPPAQEGLRRTLLLLAAAQLDDQTEVVERRESLVDWLRRNDLPDDWRPLVYSALGAGGTANRDAFLRLLAPLTVEGEIRRASANLAQTPDHLESLLQRAGSLARLRRWRESADDRLRAVELAPEDRILWGQAATALLAANDVEGYRRHCRRMLDRFEKTERPEEADSCCKTCLLLPDAVDATRLPIKVLRQALDAPERHPYHPWFVACDALVRYRADDLEGALRQAESVAEVGPPIGWLVAPLRALIHLRRGERARALEILDRLRGELPPDLPRIDASDDGVLDETTVTHDVLVIEFLRREAERLAARPESP